MVGTLIETDQPAPPSAQTAPPRVLAALPVAAITAVLLLAGTYEGGYALRHWAPVAVLALVLLAALRPLRLPSLPALIAVAGLWLFALWVLLSATWSPNPDGALDGAGRALLYAALLTLPIVAVPDAATARRLAVGLAAALGLVVLVVAVRFAVEGTDLLLAGRLDKPVGYRNGAAALFALIAVPLICVAATREVAAPLRSLAFGLALMALGLAFVTQSRGVLVGFTVGALVAVALGPDRLRRTWLFALAAGAVALASDPLLAPYDGFLARRFATPGEATRASDAVLLLGGLGAVVMLLVALVDGGIRVSAGAQRAIRGVAAGLLIAGSLGLAVGALAVIGNPIGWTRDKVDEFRALDAPAPGESRTRLGSTGGQRYDLWRVAVDEWESAPIAGVGEGGYPVRYYAERRTDRNLSTPHSLVIGILAENGLVGLLLFAGAIGAAAWAVAGRVRALDRRDRRWVSALAGAAAVVLAQSALDWLWLIPVLAGIALVALGLAVRIADDGAPSARGTALFAVRAVAALGAAGVALLFLSNLYVREARAERDGDPAAQLRAAQHARSLNPYNLDGFYLEAGALERLGRRDEARAVLRDAVAREPANFVTYALLGDLETRAGRRDAARRDYRAALARNPLDTGLQQLAR